MIARNIFVRLNSSAFFLKIYSQSRIGVTNDSFYFEGLSDRSFPSVWVYSTLLAVLSIAVVGIISFNVAF